MLICSKKVRCISSICSCALGFLFLCAGLVLVVVHGTLDRFAESAGAYNEWTPSVCVIEGFVYYRSFRAHCGLDGTGQCQRWVLKVSVDGRNDSVPLPACLRFCRPSLVPFDGSKPERGAEAGERRSCLVHRDANFMTWSEWDATEAGEVSLKRVVLIGAKAGDFVEPSVVYKLETSFIVLFCFMGAFFLLFFALCCSVDPSADNDAAVVVATLDNTNTVPPTWVKVEPPSSEPSEQPSTPAS
jgi:hypothetical protein